MFTIIGSGFGLYGYLPALLAAPETGVVLTRSYQHKLISRPELTKFFSRIRWVETQDEALTKCTGIVLATTPARQMAIASRLGGYPKVSKVILEKPLAMHPQLAVQLLDTVLRAGVDCRVGYTFPYCVWYSRVALAAAQSRSDEVKLRWSFMAHHFAHGVQTWKRRHDDGGGVLRFYGIQVIALLASLGYSDVEDSRIAGRMVSEPERWEASFVGKNLPTFKVELDSFSEATEFSIRRQDADGHHYVLLQRDPFAEEMPTFDQDIRIRPLIELLRSFDAEMVGDCALYRGVNSLWLLVERKSSFAQLCH